MNVSILPEGLRTQKQKRTRQRITEVGLRLFGEIGFEATTLTMIAAAAEISPRTFFHYFDSKEAIFAAWESDMEDAVSFAVSQQPEEASPLAVVHGALVQLNAIYETAEALAIDKLMHSTEALRARRQANFERKERAVFASLIERWPEPERHLSLRLVAMIGIGAMRVAMDNWRQEPEGGRNLAQWMEETFSQVRAEMKLELAQYGWMAANQSASKANSR